MPGAGKILLVTGGSRGIGAAISRLGARAGYRVAVNYVANANAANQVVAAISAVAATSCALATVISRFP